MNAVEKWFHDMRLIWLEKRPNDMANLIAEHVEYYETPFDPPLKNADDIKKEWQAILNQDIQFIDIDVLFSSNTIGMAQWKFKEKNSALHIGGYYLKLNDKGKCIEFRQWWNDE